MTGEVLITLDGLSKTYGNGKNSVKAVRNINLEIYKGETFGLVGESGCGKSTLGNMLVQLVDASNGHVLYKGKDITAVKKKERKSLYRSLQIVFQDPYSSIDPKKTIGWLLEEPLEIHHIYRTKKERKEAALKMLETVGLQESYYSRYPGELSGGQRQRIAIAIALMLEPEFIVCDEAVSALDVSVQAQILNLLRKLQKEKDLTYLFISHNLNVVSYMSDRIGVMYLGEIVELANAQDIASMPMHPYSQALFSASLDAKERIILEGDLPSPNNPPKGCPFHTRCFRCKEKCRVEKPTLKEYEKGHYCACFYAEEQK